MAPKRPEAYFTVHRVADAMERRVIRLIRGTFRRAATQMGDIEAQLESGRTPRVDWERVQQALRADLTGILRDIATKAALALESELPTTLAKHVIVDGAGDLVFRFDITNPRALAWATRHAAEMVTNITFESRQAIRDLVLRAFREGIPPAQLARMIRDSIGLNRIQTNALMNFQLALLESDLFPDEQASKLATYRNRLHRYRATTIARTETMNASNQGQQLLWEQALADGVLEQGARRKWIVTLDERLCAQCAPIPSNPQNNGVPLDGFFIDGFGGRVANPPAHPRCRCVTGLIFPDETGEYPPVPSATPAFAGESAAPRRRPLRPRI